MPFDDECDKKGTLHSSLQKDYFPRTNVLQPVTHKEIQFRKIELNIGLLEAFHKV